MLRRVALLRTDDSEERSDSIIRVTRIGELGTMLAVTSNQRTLLDVGYPEVSHSCVLLQCLEALELHAGEINLPPTSLLCTIITFPYHSRPSAPASPCGDTAFNVTINHKVSKGRRAIDTEVSLCTSPYACMCFLHLL
jgi:hypothetical protein